jgi:hypothetical protein
VTIAFSRYCDICGGMPWWAEPLLVVTGFAVAIAILAGLVRLDAWFSKRRLARKRGAEPRDDAQTPVDGPPDANTPV